MPEIAIPKLMKTLTTCIALAGLFLFTVPGAHAYGVETQSHSKTWEGVDRPYDVVAPVGTTEPAPAFLLLHYAGGNGAGMIANVEATRWATDHGAFVIAPNAVGGRWADEARVGGSDDVGFIASILEDAIATYPIDSSRIYVVGMSNGGFMATRFACERSDLVAGLGVVAATTRNSQLALCHPEFPVATVLIHGTWDLVVPYSNPVGMLSQPDNFRLWAGFNGCDLSSTVNYALPDGGADITTSAVQRVDECSSGMPVALYTVTRGGHTWPDWKPRLPSVYLGATSRDWSATDELWAALSAYRR
ncbi:hypothetical protein E4T66_17615 [Sinimarinibacterium sp. CAU 1509]|uniref:alpha/beta hydrolase family esterase n=1 Tax=Sinimarinibacterium sp. CAU 1509 TaxID=2562283 RepID=UPI0010AD3B05|nr:PHB depolymerase family esterase [Sinimarinibacterium sp. CAU 1509]TJY57226.1 hypothetical protein E4T66_17615 [Sinimarinibacterium sp. CAU 1509]